MKTSELFSTKEDIEAAVVHFRSLKQHAGWQLLCSMLENDVEDLTRQILDGNDKEEEIDILRAALKIYQMVLEAPDKWIKELQTPEPNIEVEDPYYTVEGLKEMRKNRSKDI